MTLTFEILFKVRWNPFKSFQLLEKKDNICFEGFVFKEIFITNRCSDVHRIVLNLIDQNQFRRKSYFRQKVYTNQRKYWSNCAKTILRVWNEKKDFSRFVWNEKKISVDLSRSKCFFGPLTKKLIHQKNMSQ